MYRQVSGFVFALMIALAAAGMILWLTLATIEILWSPKVSHPVVRLAPIDVIF